MLHKILQVPWWNQLWLKNFNNGAFLNAHSCKITGAKLIASKQTKKEQGKAWPRWTLGAAVGLILT